MEGKRIAATEPVGLRSCVGVGYRTTGGRRWERPTPTTWDDIEEGNEVELPSGTRQIVRTKAPGANGSIDVTFENGSTANVQPDDMVKEVID
jgi:hypothetical protein